MHERKDTLYANPLARVDQFNFDQQVVDVFPDMIKRSVPGYPTIVSMIGSLAERYVTAGSHCYDLGCSLGAATLAMRHRIQTANCRIIAIDNSPAMLKRARQVIAADSLEEVPVEFIEARIQDVAMSNASMVVLNFTLQFIKLAERSGLLENIYRALNPGGVLIISEKVAFADAPLQALMTDLHHNFKRANGYSELEIAQKRAAIENVLIPETLTCHRERLRAVGFASVDVWFQCLNFASIIAIK
jgi:tRNA (cmo5U34)-methyltransferase